MNVSLFIPSLNERLGIVQIMPRVHTGLFSQILVCDLNSTDGTADYARSLRYDVLMQKRPGMRFAFIEAWPHITGDYVVTFSPDGNCPPEDLPRLIAKAHEGFDMVIA